MPIDSRGWWVPWEPSLLAASALVVSASLYMRGNVKCPSSHFHKLCFWLGLIGFYGVSQTDFDYYAEHEFFIHRFQHSVLHHTAPFLIALSRPGPTLAAGLPDGWRNQAAQLLNTRAARAVAACVNNPVAAVALFIGLIIFWLVPPVHFIAMLDWRLYRSMNWSVAIDGLLFWNLVLNNYALRPVRLSPACRIAMMLSVIPPQIAIGALIFFAPQDLFPVYAVCGRIFEAVSPAADQQLGGLILWIHGAMMSVIGVLVIVKREWVGRKAAASITP